MSLATYQREERGDFDRLARNRALLCQGAQDFSEVGHLVSHTVRRANTSVDVDLRVVRACITRISSVRYRDHIQIMHRQISVRIIPDMSPRTAVEWRRMHWYDMRWVGCLVEGVCVDTNPAQHKPVGTRQTSH